MDFSKKYLLKYGWEEGQGLGKTKSGIKTAIKAKLKFDKAGMGYDPSLEFTDSWWVKVYNDALEDTHIQNEENTKDKLYEDILEEKEVKIKINTRKRKFKEESFSDLFRACEGRTVHKGARQGLQLSGKLQRLEQQELTLLPKKEYRSNTEEEASTVKHNKYQPLVDEPPEEKKTTRKHKNKLCSGNNSPSEEVEYNNIHRKIKVKRKHVNEV